MRRTKLWALVMLVVATQVAAEGRSIEGGVLDEIHLRVDSLAAGQPVTVIPFSTEDTDLGTGGEDGKPAHREAAREALASAPEILARSLARNLIDLGAFPGSRVVLEAAGPSEGLRVEGRFTRLDPGSRAKRYLAGFGAGKGVVEVEGRVLDARGKVLAEFRQKRLTVMGLAGGDSRKKMASDAEAIGEDIARFLTRWAEGKPLD